MTNFKVDKRCVILYAKLSKLSRLNIDTLFLIIFFFKSSAFDFIIHHIEKYLSQTNFVDSKQFISHNVPFKRPRQFSFIPPFGSAGLQNKGEKGTDDPS